MSVGVVPHITSIFQPLRVFVRIAHHLKIFHLARNWNWWTKPQGFHRRWRRRIVWFWPNPKSWDAPPTRGPGFEESLTQLIGTALNSTSISIHLWAALRVFHVLLVEPQGLSKCLFSELAATRTPSRVKLPLCCSNLQGPISITFLCLLPYEYCNCHFVIGFCNVLLLL